MLAVGSTNILKVIDLIDNLTGEPVTDATVTATLTTLDGITLADDLSFDHAGSGTYVGELSASVPLTHNTLYYLNVTATAGDITLFKRHVEQAAYSS
jgi:hypothetical protein